MSEDHKKQLEQQLWNIANTLRGKMNADEFRDYILGFIFYKYLSEKMWRYADIILKQDKIKYTDIDENSAKGKEYIEAIKEESLEKLGYFLKPSELFSEVAKRGNSDKEGGDNFILEDLAKILSNIEQSTMGTASEDDFDNLFEDLDLTSTKLGRTESAKNELISKVLFHWIRLIFIWRIRSWMCWAMPTNTSSGSLPVGRGRRRVSFIRRRKSARYWPNWLRPARVSSSRFTIRRVVRGRCCCVWPRR